MKDTTLMTASFSPCGRYRYRLRWPTENRDGGTMLFIGANPSKAGQRVNGCTLSDPTVSQMHGRAERMGYGALEVVNVRAWIETDPDDVPAGAKAIEHEPGLNAHHIASACERASVVLCAWGQLVGEALNSETLRIVRGAGKIPHCLGKTKDGFPRHPRGVSLEMAVIPMEIWV